MLRIRKVSGGMTRALGSRGGFTMVELMVVVVVIAILATAVGFASTKLIGSSIEANMKSDAKSVHSALVEHYVDYNRFPSSLAPSATGTASATTMLFDASDGNTLALASGGTATQVTINVTNPKKPGYTCSITARPSGTAKAVCT